VSASVAQSSRPVGNLDKRGSGGGAGTATSAALIVPSNYQMFGLLLPPTLSGAWGGLATMGAIQSPDTYFIALGPYAVPADGTFDRLGFYLRGTPGIAQLGIYDNVPLGGAAYVPGWDYPGNRLALFDETSAPAGAVFRESPALALKVKGGDRIWAVFQSHGSGTQIQTVQKWAMANFGLNTVAGSDPNAAYGFLGYRTATPHSYGLPSTFPAANPATIFPYNNQGDDIGGGASLWCPALYYRFLLD
jgi:hypothetical protein